MEILFNIIWNNYFTNLIIEIIDFHTPSSDYNAWFSDRESAIIWGRHGNDSLVGFDPGVDQPDQGQIDIFFGDLVDEELYELWRLVGEDLERTPRDWKDRFILGDWQQPYYVEGQPLTLGLNQFAVIADFSPSQDLIGLHGTPQE